MYSKQDRLTKNKADFMQITTPYKITSTLYDSNFLELDIAYRQVTQNHPIETDKYLSTLLNHTHNNTDKTILIGFFGLHGIDKEVDEFLEESLNGIMKEKHENVLRRVGYLPNKNSNAYKRNPDASPHITFNHNINMDILKSLFGLQASRLKDKAKLYLKHKVSSNEELVKERSQLDSLIKKYI